MSQPFNSDSYILHLMQTRHKDCRNDKVKDEEELKERIREDFETK